MPEEIVDHRKRFGPELYGSCASPQALIGEVQAKGIEEDALFVSHSNHRSLPKRYDRLHHLQACSEYCPLLMK